VQVLHEFALGVRLEAVDLELELAREADNLLFELAQREPAVVRRVAATEHVQVDAVHHLDAVARGAHRHTA